MFWLVPLQPLQGIQEEGGFSESQEAGYVGGCEGHHLTVLIQNLEKGEGTKTMLIFPYLILVIDSLLIKLRPVNCTWAVHWSPTCFLIYSHIITASVHCFLKQWVWIHTSVGLNGAQTMTMSGIRCCTLRTNASTPECVCVCQGQWTDTHKLCYIITTIIHLAQNETSVTSC